ncbi:hypothetical protein EIP86_000128, partial [Pleurotus ostreatoroseus]
PAVTPDPTAMPCPQLRPRPTIALSTRVLSPAATLTPRPAMSRRDAMSTARHPVRLRVPLPVAAPTFRPPRSQLVAAPTSLREARPAATSKPALTPVVPAPAVTSGA